MGRFSGIIGFVKTVETEPGIWEETNPERKYRGDMFTRKVNLSNSADTTNADLTIRNEISIVADKFAYENLGYMRYVILGGQKWAVSSAVIVPPRITLTVGGLYHE